MALTAAAGAPWRRFDLAAFGRALSALRVVSPAQPVQQPFPEYVAPEMGPVFRWYFARPRDVRFDAGAWCPMCDHVLSLVRRPAGGWRCMAPSCWAEWDVQGRRGRWIGGESR